MPTRRRFVQWLGLMAAAGLRSARSDDVNVIRDSADGFEVFLCGDVMTGRGIDQALPHSADPRLYEPWVRDAREYLRLAEDANGTIPAPLPFDYVWGDALGALRQRKPAASLINLETAVTARGEPWPGKGIHYRMHPGNIPCLTAAGIDTCVLANNHVLDWGYDGLDDTLASLHEAGMHTPGAGRTLQEARAPAITPIGTGRLLVFALGTESAGIPDAWAAGDHKPGLWHTGVSGDGARRVAGFVRESRQPGDRVIVSIHWGANWGYDIPRKQRAFAHTLIDEAHVDVVYGHSSHHPKGLEFYGSGLVLYGCGDLLNDYEGISGHERFRPDLSLLYFVRLGADGVSPQVNMTPMRIRRFRLEHASEADARWLSDVLDSHSRALNARVELSGAGELRARPQSA